MKQTSDPALDWAKWLGGAAAGALLMYMLDPERGGERRAASGQALRSLTRQTGSALGHAMHEAGSSMGGMGDVGRRLVRRAGGLAERAGEAVSKPNGAAGQAVPALADQLREAGRTSGRDSGPASGQDSEQTTVRDRARHLAEGARGVARDAGAGAGELLHSAGHGAGQLMHGAQTMVRDAREAIHGAAEQLRGDWAPGMRGAAVLGGGALGLYGLLRRSPAGMLLGLAGLALLARGATNLPLRRVVSGELLAQAIDLEKTIHIDAAPERVYDLWANYENFPRFMSHVLEVRDLGGRRSHWVVKGPGGSEFAWNAVTTEQSRPHRLAWRSEPGADIAQSGSIQFEASRGGTRVTVRMSYSPPAGVLGHGIAMLLGADPQRQMDEDLARMKHFIERGEAPRDEGRQSGFLSRLLH